MSARYATIAATGRYLPEIEVTNEALRARFNARFPEFVDKMEAALKGAGKTAEFVVYPGAGHAFFADYRPSYQPVPAKDAWQRALAWFARYLKA